MIPPPNIEVSFDAGYCKGPYACDVPMCVIYGVSDDSQPAFRTPAACPVVIEDAVTNQLWAVAAQPNSSIVMYNFGVGPRFAYVSASSRAPK